MARVARPKPTPETGVGGRGRPPEVAARRAGLEFVENLFPAMIRVVPRWLV
jgi:hypothetical protein